MNAAAFDQLHRTYWQRLRCAMLSVVRNQEEADDIAATAFAVAFDKRRDFRGQASFYTYLYRIACNEAQNTFRRKRTVSLEALESSLPEALIERDLLAQRLDRADCCRRIRKALRELPIHYRRVLVDHFIRRCRTRRIALQEGIPVGTVLSRIHTGKRLLRAAWES